MYGLSKADFETHFWKLVGSFIKLGNILPAKKNNNKIFKTNYSQSLKVVLNAFASVSIKMEIKRIAQLF